jgi:phosphoribosylformylglycinamidine cyclo-ligase
LDKSYKNYPESFDPAMADEVCYIGKHKLTDVAENGMTIGKMLLSPTRTFAPVVKQVVEKYGQQIHGIVHNTGGGQTKCMKYIDGNVRLIKDNLFTPPLIFDLIQQASGIDYREMYQVFNMGNRLDVYTSAAIAEEIIALAASFNIDAQIVGRVEAAEKKELVIRSAFGEFVF